MGGSRGGLTTKIHEAVDSHGLPVRLALTSGESHDNRLAFKLLARLRWERGCCLIVATTHKGQDRDNNP